jgi:hypothetical protein
MRKSPLKTISLVKMRGEPSLTLGLLLNNPDGEIDISPTDS